MKTVLSYCWAVNKDKEVRPETPVPVVTDDRYVRAEGMGNVTIFFVNERSELCNILVSQVVSLAPELDSSLISVD